MGELAAALADLQTKLPHILKDNAAIIQAKEGGKTYGYKYADLATITKALMPLLGGLGLSFSCQPTIRDDGKFVLAYQLVHAADTDTIDGAYPLPTGTPQQIGSAITYARRYCLCAVTGAVADEDDDGAEAERADGLPTNRDGSLSRRGTTDEQKTAAGVMTDAQQRAHNALERDTLGVDSKGRNLHNPRGPVDAAVDDRWTSDAPSWVVGVDPPEDQPGSILPAQRSQIMAVYTALGIKDRDLRLSDVCTVLELGSDRPGQQPTVGSVNELSHQQAARLLENLHERHTGKMTRR